MDKAALRKAVTEKLKRLTEDEKHEIEKKMTDVLVRSEVWKEAKMIGITLANGFEWDTQAIIETGWRQGKSICVPKCDPKMMRLNFYRFTDYDQLEVVYYNLREPKPQASERVEIGQMDLLIVPGIVFDREGFRIGFGGGYYDRFLEGQTIQTVSLAHSMQIVDKVPTEPFDVPVDRLVSEKGMVVCKKA